VQSAFLAPDVVKAKDWAFLSQRRRSIDRPRNRKKLHQCFEGRNQTRKTFRISASAWSLLPRLAAPARPTEMVEADGARLDACGNA